MSDMLGNNVTARVPGEDGHWLINPLGCCNEEVTASSVVKIDMEGNIVLDSLPPYEVNQAGVVIHGAMHRARADVACVIHTIRRRNDGVGAGMRDIALVQSAMRFGAVAYHDLTGSRSIWLSSRG